MRFCLVEDAFTKLATWQKCWSAYVGLELRNRSEFWAPKLPYIVDVMAAKHLG